MINSARLQRSFNRPASQLLKAGKFDDVSLRLDRDVSASRIVGRATEQPRSRHARTACCWRGRLRTTNLPGRFALAILGLWVATFLPLGCHFGPMSLLNPTVHFALEGESMVARSTGIATDLGSAPLPMERDPADMSD